VSEREGIEASPEDHILAVSTSGLFTHDVVDDSRPGYHGGPPATELLPHEWVTQPRIRAYSRVGPPIGGEDVGVADESQADIVLNLASTDGGIVRPRAFAVLRLITRSKLRPLDGSRRALPLEEFVHVAGSSPVEIRDARAVGYQASIVTTGSSRQRETRV
jgi:hypothetical protein